MKIVMIVVVCGFGIIRVVLIQRIRKNILFINWGFGKYVEIQFKECFFFI